MNQKLLERQKTLFKVLKLPAMEEKAVELLIALAFRDGIIEGLEQAKILSREVFKN